MSIFASTFGYNNSLPTHPWGSPWLALLDTIRVAIFIMLAWDIVILLYAYLRRGIDLVRVVAIVGMCIVAFETEWDHLGLGVGKGGRLWITLVAFGAVTIYVTRRWLKGSVRD